MDLIKMLAPTLNVDEVMGDLKKFVKSASDIAEGIKALDAKMDAITIVLTHIQSDYMVMNDVLEHICGEIVTTKELIGGGHGTGEGSGNPRIDGKQDD